MKYKYVLFDLDGTLIDTNELIMHSLMYTLNLFYPGKFTQEDLLAHMGEPLYDQMRIYGPERVQELVDVYRERHKQVYHEFVKEFPGVKDTLVALKGMGVKMAVVTSKMRGSAERDLHLFGLAQYMDSVICYQDTKKHKPDPAPLLKSMDELRADPAKTIMIGDSQYDVLAAHNTGIDSAGVAWSWKGADFLRSFSPTYILNQMRELIDIVKHAPVK
jgi:pyrophosphatase PpaX